MSHDSSYSISQEELSVIKAIVSDTPENVIMLKQDEGVWTTWPGDEDALNRFRNTAYYKICIPRDTDLWSDIHLNHLSVAMQKSLLFFALKPDRAEIHYR